MPRRRRFTPTRRTRRPKGDWVYRGMAIRADGGMDDLASYHNQPRTITSGLSGSDAFILYDSKMYLQMGVRQGMLGGGAGPATYSLPNAARSEGSRARMLRVQGVIRLIPSSWAVGNQILCGWRIMAVPQDSGSGSILLDNDYSMWAGTGASQEADHANARRLNLFEKRFMEVFNSSESAMWTIRFNVRLRVSLNPNECLALYTESQAAGVTVTQQTWLRTFVVDEGSQ